MNLIDPQLLTAIGVLAGGIAALLETLRQLLSGDQTRRRGSPDLSGRGAWRRAVMVKDPQLGAALHSKADSANVGNGERADLSIQPASRAAMA